MIKSRHIFKNGQKIMLKVKNNHFDVVIFSYLLNVLKILFNLCCFSLLKNALGSFKY